MSQRRFPNYRFAPLVQKASELCSEVKSLGAALLSALEKRDAGGIGTAASGARNRSPRCGSHRQGRAGRRSQGHPRWPDFEFTDGADATDVLPAAACRSQTIHNCPENGAIAGGAPSDGVHRHGRAFLTATGGSEGCAPARAARGSGSRACPGVARADAVAALATGRPHRAGDPADESLRKAATG